MDHSKLPGGANRVLKISDVSRKKHDTARLANALSKEDQAALSKPTVAPLARDNDAAAFARAPGGPFNITALRMAVLIHPGLPDVPIFAADLAGQQAIRNPFQREVGMKLSWEDPKNVVALLAQISGTEVVGVKRCKHCAEGGGPWQACVLLKGHMLGGCANCWYSGLGHRCTHYQGNKGIFQPIPQQVFHQNHNQIAHPTAQQTRQQNHNQIAPQTPLQIPQKISPKTTQRIARKTPQQSLLQAPQQAMPVPAATPSASQKPGQPSKSPLPAGSPTIAPRQSYHGEQQQQQAATTPAPVAMPVPGQPETPFLAANPLLQEIIAPSLRSGNAKPDKLRRVLLAAEKMAVELHAIKQQYEAGSSMGTGQVGGGNAVRPGGNNNQA